MRLIDSYESYFSLIDHLDEAFVIKALRRHISGTPNQIGVSTNWSNLMAAVNVQKLQGIVPQLFHCLQPSFATLGRVHSGCRNTTLFQGVDLILCQR